jgi:hypothetical protein
VVKFAERWLEMGKGRTHRQTPCAANPPIIDQRPPARRRVAGHKGCEATAGLTHAGVRCPDHFSIHRGRRPPTRKGYQACRSAQPNTAFARRHAANLMQPFVACPEAMTAATPESWHPFGFMARRQAKTLTGLSTKTVTTN